MIASRYQCWLAGGAPADLDPELSALVPALHARAERILGNASDADDAVQETLVHLLKHRLILPADIPLAGIVHQVGGQQTLMAARRRRRRLSRYQPLGEPHDAAPAAAPLDDVADALPSLPCRDRTLLLGLTAGVPRSHLARTLGLTINALGVAIHRARRRLAAALASPHLFP